MKRAYLIEMTVLGDYVKRLLGTALIVSVCIGLGMRSFIVVPGILAAMFFTVGAITSSAYDEHNGWGLFRLTMPVSRREVVLGRYGATATLGLLGAAVGAVAAFVLGAAATVLPLSGDLAEGLRLSPDGLRAMGLSTACCLAAGALIAAVETPVYLRFGQTKATQWLPLVVFALVFGSSLVLGASGLLDGDALTSGGLAGLLALADTPLGALACSGALLVLAAAALCISALVSIKLYEHREL